MPMPSPVRVKRPARRHGRSGKLMRGGLIVSGLAGIGLALAGVSGEKSREREDRKAETVGQPGVSA
jgi:hypothetical protein